MGGGVVRAWSLRGTAKLWRGTPKHWRGTTKLWRGPGGPKKGNIYLFFIVLKVLQGPHDYMVHAEKKGGSVRE